MWLCKRVCVALAWGIVLLAPTLQARVWPDVVVKLQAELAHRDVENRRAAARKLGELPSSAAAGLLPLALADADAAVRVEASRAAIRTGYALAAQAVTPWFADPDAALRRAAARVLAVFGEPSATAALTRSLGDPDSAVRALVAEALGSVQTNEARSALLGRLDDSDALVILAVIDALERFADPETSVALAGKLQDSRPATRTAAARALGVIGGDATSLALASALRDADQKVRLAVVQALGRSGSVQASEPLRLRSVDGREVADVRVAALRALAELAQTPAATSAAVSALLSGVLTEREEVSTEAQAQLISVARACAADAACLQLLERCVLDVAAPRGAAACVQCLATAGAAGAFEAVVQAERAGNLDQLAALDAFALLRDARALPFILEALAHPDRRLRAAAARAALQTLQVGPRDGRAVDPILQALAKAQPGSDEHEDLVALLGATRTERAAHTLIPLSLAPTPARVRRAALRALGALDVSSPAIDAALLSSVTDPHAPLRLEATRAIRRVGSAALAAPLLQQLQASPGANPAALALSLAGPFARIDPSDRSQVLRVGQLLALAKRSRPALREAMIEALALVPSGQGLSALLTLSQTPAARAKVAEALGLLLAQASPQPADLQQVQSTLRALAQDRSVSVRANAIWSLGQSRNLPAAQEQARQSALLQALSDPAVQVAANAAAALQSVKTSAGPQLAQRLCAALKDSRPYVRVNALVAVSARGETCSPEITPGLLERDPSELVRMQAARGLQNARRSSSAASARSALALKRCLSHEPRARVAEHCALNAPSHAPTAETEELPFAATLVLVVPHGESVPQPGAEFALALPSGELRLGFADQQGALSLPAPASQPASRQSEQLRLEVPAALAE